MARSLEVRRHAPNSGDALTPEGVLFAVDIGTRLQGPYEVAFSSGAQRATQTLACLLAGLGQVIPGGVVVEPGLRSTMEDRWLTAYRTAGSAQLSALRAADPELFEDDSARLAAALRRILDSLPEGMQALAVAHGATTEAAVFALTGKEVDPLQHGAGVRVTESSGGYDAEMLPSVS